MSVEEQEIKREKMNDVSKNTRCIWLRNESSCSQPPKISHPPQFRPLIADISIVLKKGGTLDSSLGKREIENNFLQSIPTDRQFQAHIMQYLKDHHKMTFEERLNPNAPTPQYFS